MTPFTSIIENVDGSWYFTWAAGTGPYRVILNGLLLVETEDTSYTWEMPGYEGDPPPIEVANVGEMAQSETHPPWFKIQWFDVAGAEFYQVERYLLTGWAVVRIILDDNLPMYEYAVPNVPDGDEIRLRVSSGTAGGVSSPVTFTKEMVTSPSPPDVVLSYGAGFLSVVGA